MMTKKVLDAFNTQINAEFFSAYMYLSMAAWFEGRNLSGMATWMKMQALEEREHAMKFFDFIHERGGTVTLAGLADPPTEWNSPLALFQAAYEHEQYVTSLIYRLVEVSAQEKDYAANVFLQWFVTEQVEEEASASEVVEKLKMAGTNKGALYMLDRELGARGAGH